MLAVAACGDDDGGGDDSVGGADAGTGDVDSGPSGVCEVTPSSWSAPDFETNAAGALALRAQLDALTGTTMRGAEEETVTLDGVADLEELYQAETPSIEDVTTAAWQPIVADAFEEFVALIGAGDADLVNEAQGSWTPGAEGGIYGASRRGINEGGLEIRQVLDKGLFGGATLYNYALGLTEGTIDEATIDALAAAWGANSELDAAGELTDSANYSFRMGFHAEIAEQLIAAKAYAGDSDCVAERDAAIQEFFRTWELALMARFVFYANAGATGVAEAATDDDYAGAFHAFTEGVGLGVGLYGVPTPASGPMSGGARVITDAEIETMATALGIDLTDLGASTTGEFVEAPEDFATAVETAEGVVQDAYDLTDADIEAFRAPTEG